MKKLLILFLVVPALAFGQVEELKQRTALFKQEKSEAYKIKPLNGNEPDYGVLSETNFIHHEYFQLKQNEKELNELGNSVKPKYDLSTYAYEDADELKSALKFWFKEFIGNKRITPGRDYRTVDHVKPAVIIMDKNYIAILTLSCYSVDIEEFRQWRSDMLGIFGSPEAMIIEIGCDGPLEWTKNAPDPKDTSWRR